MDMKKKLLAIGAACGLSFNLCAEAPGETSIFFGAPETLVIDEAAPVPGEQMCTGNPEDESTECWAAYRAIAVARYRKAVRHGTWT
jgi:hypothetical protein